MFQQLVLSIRVFARFVFGEYDLRTIGSASLYKRGIGKTGLKDKGIVTVRECVPWRNGR